MLVLSVGGKTIDELERGSVDGRREVLRYRRGVGKRVC